MKSYNSIPALSGAASRPCDFPLLSKHDSFSAQKDHERAARDGAQGMPGKSTTAGLSIRSGKRWRELGVQASNGPVLLKTPARTAIPSTRAHCR